YVPGSAIALEPLAEDAAKERLALIADYYEARKQALTMDGNATPYQPLPPDRLYLADAQWHQRLDAGRMGRMTAIPGPEGGANVIEAGTRAGRNFAPERTQQDGNVFEAVKEHVDALQKAGKRVTIALWSDGARERMSHVLADHRIVNLVNVADWRDA